MQNPMKKQDSPPVSIQAFGIAIPAYPMDKESIMDDEDDASCCSVLPAQTCTLSGQPLLSDMGPMAVTDPAFCVKTIAQR